MPNKRGNRTIERSANHVHHIDGNPLNNAPSNLLVMQNNKVVGEPSIRKWTQGEKTGTSVEVNVRDVVLLGAPGGQKEDGATEENTDDNGVPF